MQGIFVEVETRDPKQLQDCCLLSELEASDGKTDSVVEHDVIKILKEKRLLVDNVIYNVLVIVHILKWDINHSKSLQRQDRTRRDKSEWCYPSFTLVIREIYSNIYWDQTKINHNLESWQEFWSYSLENLKVIIPSIV